MLRGACMSVRKSATKNNFVFDFKVLCAKLHCAVQFLQNNAQILEIPHDSAYALSVARSTRNANL